MGLVVEMGFRVRNFVAISIKTCYRSVLNYPFLFGIICFLVLLYRSCPFLFSFVVSASPVLICTVALLGTLLSFGHPNIPEVETKDKDSSNVASFRSGIFDDATIVAKEDHRFNKVGNSYEEGSSEEDEKSRKLDEHAGFVDFVPMIHEREIRFERGGVEGFEKAAIVEKELHGLEFVKRRVIFERDFGIKTLDTDGENIVENQLLAPLRLKNMVLEVENHNILIESVHQGDQLGLSLNDNADKADNADHDRNDYDSLGSESDTAESSSPDASMADIMPLLDEFDPLLDSESPLLAHRSNEESDASSKQSHQSDSECVISDDEAENQGEEGGVEDDDDDDEGMLEEKEDESKSAIKWTEDDQKNLMDLGSLELERNQRLENVIARRRAWSSLRMLAGKNLIDLEGCDLPVNVSPISTTRHNPFDLPYDSNNNMGLPPIPGSAPSILLPRRNPFDLPYDPNEENPDLKSDDFGQDFFPPQHKDIFRRHESFSVGPSNFAVPKEEQHNIRWKPYFIPVKIAAEGTSCSPLEGQFSESKQSSISDTESIGSIADEDDKKPDESQTFMEITTISYLDPTTSSIAHGNGSWEDIGSEDYVQENRNVHHEVIEITLGSSASHFENQSRSSEIGAADTLVEISTEIHSKTALVETDFSSNSSMCSLSEEVNKKSFAVKTDEVRSRGLSVEESGIETTSTSLPVSLNFSSEVMDDNQHREPVYDSSPSAEGKDSDVHSEIEQDITSGLKDVHDASAELHVVDKNEQESRKFSEVIVCEITKVEPPKHVTGDDAHNLSMVRELLVEHVLVDTGPSFSDIALIEKGIVNNIKEDKDQLTSHKEDSIDGIHKIEDEKLGFSPSSDQISSWSLTSTKPEDQLSSAINHVSADMESPSDAKHVEIHETLNNEDNAELGQTKIHRSSSSDISSVEELVLQNDVVCHIDQPSSSKSIRGSEIPVMDLEELVAITDYVATSHDHLTTTNATTPVSQEQKNSAEVEEQAVLVSSSSTFPSELKQVEECSINKKEVVESEQDFFRPSSVKSHTESESLRDLDIKIASSGRSSTPNVTPEVISSVSESEQSWSDKPMVEPVIDHYDDAEEPGNLTTDSATKVNSENISPNVHQDVESNFSSSSSDHDFRSPFARRDSVFESREEVSKHLDYLAKEYGTRFLEKMMREELDDIADIDEGLLLELDEVGNFSIKEVGEPAFENDVMPKEAQAKGFKLGSVSNPTEAKSDIPIPEAISLYDTNLAFRQLHEVENQAKEEAKAETSSDSEVVEGKSMGDTHAALMQVSEKNLSELPTSPVSNDPSKESEPAGGDSAISIVLSKTTDADKPVDTTIDPKISASKTKDDADKPAAYSATKTKGKKAKSGKSKSGSSSSSSLSSSDSDSD